MIIDAHAHLGRGARSDASFYLRLMDEAGIARTVLCPGGMIDVVRLADFMRGNEPLSLSTPPNDLVRAAVRDHPDRFYGFFYVDPESHDIGDVERALADGFSGLKLNPLVSRVEFGKPLIRDVFRLSHDRRVPIYTHVTLFGGASLDALRKVVRELQPVVIVGHMGFASADGEAVELAGEFDDVYLETSVGSFRAIEEAVRVLGTSKILFGSEGPAQHVRTELLKIELLRLSSFGFEQVVCHNIAGLLSDGRRAAA